MEASERLGHEAAEPMELASLWCRHPWGGNDHQTKLTIYDINDDL